MREIVWERFATPEFQMVEKGLKGIFTYLIITLILLFCSLFFVWSRLEVWRIGYEISQEKETQKRLIEVNTQLRMELATLKSPRRIEEIACSKLGLVKPKPSQIIIK